MTKKKLLLSLSSIAVIGGFSAAAIACTETGSNTPVTDTTTDAQKVATAKSTLEALVKDTGMLLLLMLVINQLKMHNLVQIN